MYSRNVKPKRIEINFRVLDLRQSSEISTEFRC